MNEAGRVTPLYVMGAEAPAEAGSEHTAYGPIRVELVVILSLAGTVFYLRW